MDRSARAAILKLSRSESGRYPARKPDFRPGNTIASHRVNTSIPLPPPCGGGLGQPIPGPLPNSAKTQQTSLFFAGFRGFWLSLPESAFLWRVRVNNNFLPGCAYNCSSFYYWPSSPGGSRRRVRTNIFLMRSVVLGQFWPGSGGLYILNFNFGLKRSWTVGTERLYTRRGQVEV